MEGSDLLTAGVMFLFAAVAAVPLASRESTARGRKLLARYWDICWQGLRLAPGGWDLSATLMKSSTFLSWALSF